MWWHQLQVTSARVISLGVTEPHLLIGTDVKEKPREDEVHSNASNAAADGELHPLSFGDLY